jgi:hypothetical protein
MLEKANIPVKTMLPTKIAIINSMSVKPPERRRVFTFVDFC